MDKQDYERMLEFEKNKFEQGYKEKVKSIHRKLHYWLDLELEGIEEIIKYIDESKRIRIQKRVDRINKFIDEILSDIK